VKWDEFMQVDREYTWLSPTSPEIPFTIFLKRAQQFP
jgi:hypothetical protein